MRTSTGDSPRACFCRDFATITHIVAKDPKTGRGAEGFLVGEDLLGGPCWRLLPGKLGVLSQSRAGCMIGPGHTWHSVVSCKLEVETKFWEAISC